MKYRVSPLLSTGKTIGYKIQDGKAPEKESSYIFSRVLIDIWGNPSPALLKELMVAHVKKNGWSKSSVGMCEKNSPRSLSCYIADLSKKK